MENENKCIAYFNGERIRNFPPHVRVLWYGQFSEAYCNGAIMNYVESCLSKIKKNLLCVIPVGDGNHSMKNININSIIDKYQPKSKNLIIGTLAQIHEDPELSYLYLPLSDSFFMHGTRFEKELVPWENRQAIAFWRGSCSGSFYTYYSETTRYRTVKELLNYKNSNVKLTKRYNWHLNTKVTIPEEYFDNECDLSDFFKYKIVLIIDGNTIASSHMWTFATGAVPVMISNATCWFSKFLKPFIHYVPVRYDLSDLKEMIEWLINNDAKAKEIAENALFFSREYFSSEFQKKYIEDELQHFASQQNIS